MKRNEGNAFFVVVAAVAFALLAGCASVPSAETAEELSAAWLAEVRP